MLTQPFKASDALLEFHTIFNVAIRTVPVANPPEASTRKVLLVEEVQEYADAVADNDLVEIADALGDIVYIATGSGTVHGIELDQAMAEMLSPDTTPAAAAQTYYDAMERDDLEGVTTALSTLILCCYDLANGYGFNLDDVLEEIHRSNMTKLDLDGKAIVRPDGKIVKGPNYEPPHLAPLLGL